VDGLITNLLILSKAGLRRKGMVMIILSRLRVISHLRVRRKGKQMIALEQKEEICLSSWTTA